MRSVLAGCFTFALLAPSCALAQRVLIAPGSSGGASAFCTVDPLACQAGPITVPGSSSDGFPVLAPNIYGGSYYLVSPSATGAASFISSTGKLLQTPINLPQAPQAAGLSGDSKTLAILAGNLYLFDVSSGKIAKAASVAAGQNSIGQKPLDAVLSPDSRFAYVLTSEEPQLRVVDLKELKIVDTAGGLTGAKLLSLAPNGALWITGTDKAWVYDLANFRLVQSYTLPVGPGRFFFSPLGDFAFTSTSGAETGASAIQIELGTGRVTYLPALPEKLDQLVYVDSDRIYAVSRAAGKLYRIQSGEEVTEATFAGIGSIGGVVSATLSSELPVGRYLFVSGRDSKGGYGLYRIPLTDSKAKVQVTSIPSEPGVMAYAAAPVSGNGASILAYNTSQAVSPNADLLPLVARVIDKNGRPVRKAQLSFRSANLMFTSAEWKTNTQGFATATLTAPGTVGNYTVDAALGPFWKITKTYKIAVGDKIQLYSGDGQFVYPGGYTPDPIVVQVADPQGHPVHNALVTWKSTWGVFSQGPYGARATSEGQSSFSNLTDSRGLASVQISAAGTIPGSDYLVSEITAKIATSSVALKAVILGKGPLDTVMIPPADVLAPDAATTKYKVPVGQTISGAVKVHVGTAKVPVPYVGLEVVPSVVGANVPSVTCAGGRALTRLDGTATCDLVAGTKTGTVELGIKVGGLMHPRKFLVEVGKSAPALVKIVDGNGQTASPGTSYAHPLLAKVLDSNNKPIEGVHVTWEPASEGTATIKTSGATDRDGITGCSVTLAYGADPIRIRVHAGASTATFELHTTLRIGAISSVSGDHQTAAAGTAYAAPLVVVVKDDATATPHAVAGAKVLFQVFSGDASLSSSQVVTDEDGKASVNLTAGSTRGPVLVRATVDDLAPVEFQLNVN